KVILHAPLIYIHNSTIDGSGKGYLGGTNTHPDGYGSGYGHAGVSGGGGGGAYGGAGGEGGDVSPGAGGVPYGNISDTVINMGSGGGAGRLGSVDGFGGNGGAMIYLKAQKLIIDTSSIFCNGMRGYDGSYEAGGGGSGGGIKIQADTVRIKYSAMQAKAGAGGDAAGGGGGGAGGGRIKVFYAVIDTGNLILSVSGGTGGIGGYGNGENGFSGTIYFGPLVAAEEIFQNDLSVYNILPGITNGWFTVCSEKNTGELLIYNPAGRTVKKMRISNRIQKFEISELPNGIYFVKIDGCKSFAKITLIK
ncbi:MAG: T9SS type A sorting domain-containing protein, partial [candidate division WOR-3 bacterium]